MTAYRIYTSSYPAPHVPTNLSLSQLLQRYNPDDVDGHKVICEDDWSGKRITYAGIREDSARGAYGLRHMIGLKEGERVCICAPNSVRTFYSKRFFSMSNTSQVEVVNFIHAILWCGAIAV